MDRRKRCIPAERCLVELTKRDLLILDDVVRCGFLDSVQIAREHFHSQDRALHRMRQLVDARLLNATLLSSRRPNLYSCTRLGLEALADHGFATDRLRLPAPVRSSAVEHLILLNDLRLYCAALAQVGALELLEWNGGRGDDARAAGLTRQGLAPDAIVFLGGGPRERTIFAEADCGHEGADLEDKLTRYNRVLPRPDTELWLICHGDQARIQTVERMCRRAGVDRSTRLFARADTVSRPPKPLAPKLARPADAAPPGGRRW